MYKACFLYCFVCAVLPAIGADTAPVSTALTQPILAPDTTKAEWTSAVQSRIPALRCPSTPAAWDSEQQRLRDSLLKNVVLKGVPETWYTGPVRVEWGETIETEHGYRIRKLRYEGAPGMWIPALLYEPTIAAARVPGVLSVNGHVGDPGKADGSEQVRRIVLAKRGVIALHPEWISFGELKSPDNQHNQLACLNVCGVSGLSVFYLAMKRGLDVLAEYPGVDANRIAMTGLSGGGWQTILLSALDPRVAVSIPNAGYSGIAARTMYPGEIGDLEQVPPDLLTVADFAHLTAMLAPRPALLIYNAKDECCFQAGHMAASVYDPVIPFYALYGRADTFVMHINEDPGTHNYEKDNRQQFFRHLSTYFGLGWDDVEPACDGELKTFDELKVGIPQSNATLVSLAEPFLDGVPQLPAPKDDGMALAKWQEAARTRLREVIHLPEFAGATAEPKSESTDTPIHIATYALKTGPWTTPAIVLDPVNAPAASTTILFGDPGKASLQDIASRLVDAGQRVVAVDLLFQGECVIHPKNHYQYAAMLETTGERVLGHQVAQVGSIVAWARDTFHTPVAVHAKGWGSAIAALMYGGLHRQDLAHLTTEDAPATLKDLVRQRIPYNDYHALFCFGLLREFDVSDLAAMCQGVQVNVNRR